MELYLVRHGIALEREDWPHPDEGRPLTTAGMVKMREAAKGIVIITDKPDLILTSPYTRAKQTANIVHQAYEDHKIPLRETVSLTLESSFEPLFRELRKQPVQSRVMLVGHQPHLGDLISLLLHSAQNQPLKKGSIACLEVNLSDGQFSGTLQWLLTPKQLRLLANDTLTKRNNKE